MLREGAYRGRGLPSIDSLLSSLSHLSSLSSRSVSLPPHILTSPCLSSPIHSSLLLPTTLPYISNHYPTFHLQALLRDVGEQSAIQGPSFKTPRSAPSPVDGNESDASSVSGIHTGGAHPGGSSSMAHYAMEQGYNISLGKLDILHSIATTGS